VESAVDVDDLAGRAREEGARQRDDRARGRLLVGLVPAERRPVAPERLELLEAREKAKRVEDRINDIAKTIDMPWHKEWTGIEASSRRDEIRHVFDEFAQINLPTHRQSGTGLGLSLSRHLARAMGGEVSLTSRVGKGCTFTLRLPAALQA